MTNAVVRILEATGVKFHWESFAAGAEAYEKYKEYLPQELLASIERNRVALKGPITTPIGKGFPSANVTLRKIFDLYAAVRPVRSIQGIRTRYDSVEIVVIRENTEGLYAGIGGNLKRDTPDEIAVQEDVNTRKGVERILVYAFDYALRHGLRKVCMSDKANALRFAHGLWERTFSEVRRRYAELEASHLYIDTLAMEMVRDPSQFEVIVTSNMFGDVISDLGAQLQGGLGLAPSANINPGQISMFEPEFRS